MNPIPQPGILLVQLLPSAVDQMRIKWNRRKQRSCSEKQWADINTVSRWSKRSQHASSSQGQQEPPWFSEFGANRYSRSICLKFLGPWSCMAFERSRQCLPGHTVEYLKIITLYLTLGLPGGSSG